MKRWLTILLCACALAAVGAMGHHANRRVAGSMVASGTVTPWTPPTGCIAWYPFTYTNANDAVGTNNGVVYGATWTNLGSNACYLFNAANTNYISLISSDLETKGYSNTITLAVWQNRVGVGGTEQSYISDFAASKGFQFASLNTTTLRAYNFTGYNNLLAPSSRSSNTWHHVAVTFAGNGNLISMYANGLFVGSVTQLSVIAASGKETLLGARGDTANCFHGYLDDAMIFSRALTSNEVYQLYQDTLH